MSTRAEKLEELQPGEALGMLREQFGLIKLPPEQARDLFVGEPINRVKRQRDSNHEFLATMTPESQWWVISVAFHVLSVILLTLIVKAAPEPPPEKIITITEARPLIAPAWKEEFSEMVIKKVGEFSVGAQATDPDSKLKSDITVAPEIKQRAELGDHFETVNLDKPDKKSAFGNEQVKMFHSERGSADAAGGGGNQANSLQADVIGAGRSSPGSGGGWGGGIGTGIGVQRGAGKGSFGNRDGGGRKLMVMRHGGSDATEKSVDAALAWLARNQKKDGHWSCAEFGGGDYDIAVTSLATLAFLAGGHTEKVGDFKDNTRRAVGWLRNHQGVNGAIGTESYEIGISTMALCEAAGMANVQETWNAARRAVDYAMNTHQSFSGGWRYQPKAEGDISVTGWYLMAFKSARIAGIDVRTGSLDAAVNFIETLQTGPSNAPGFKYINDQAAGDNQPTPRRAAIGNVCKQMLGYRARDLTGSVNRMIEEGGAPKAGREDLYYWYYGTLCAFNQSGDVWEKWNAAMKDALVSTQRSDGEETGSWNPRGPYHMQWGRVGQTALGALCLEVYYRYSEK